MQVTGVVLELVNPVKGIDGVLGRSLATIVLCESRVQGVADEVFALR